MRPDLDEDLVAFRNQALDGFRELDRATDVVPPVIGIKPAAVELAAGHSRDEADGSRYRLQATKRTRETVADDVHGRAVEGVVEIQALVEHALRREVLFENRQRARVAGNGDSIGAVDTRDANLRFQPEVGKAGLGFGGAEAYCCHLAGAAGTALLRAAMMDHPRC